LTRLFNTMPKRAKREMWGQIVIRRRHRYGIEDQREKKKIPLSMKRVTGG